MERVRFHTCSEVRMGSPFMTCSVRLQLGWVPGLPASDFQDVCAESPDGRHIALVHWLSPGNQPGFVVYTIDTVARSVSVSERQIGCCERLWWDGGARWSVYRPDA